MIHGDRRDGSLTLSFGLPDGPHLLRVRWAHVEVSPW
ncbi:hypothetical protein ABH930_005911 [Kitasatospora sp. GAS204A]|nr:hypothetical protein [Kitasatospora sp. GAS204B]